MSAFVVNCRHIDALLTAALSGRPHGGTMTWLVGECEPTDFERGQVWGSTALENCNIRRRELTHENATYVGRMLLFENRRSVAHRYDSDFEIEADPYEYRRYQAPFGPVDVLKALDCFEYQACEHPTWPKSEAFAFIEALRSRAIHALPGYEDAAWEVEPEPEPERQLRFG